MIVAKLKGSQEKYRDVQASLNSQEQALVKMTRERDRLKDKVRISWPALADCACAEQGASKSADRAGVHCERAEASPSRHGRVSFDKTLVCQLNVVFRLRQQLDALHGKELDKRSGAELHAIFKQHSDGLARVSLAMVRPIATCQPRLIPSCCLHAQSQLLEKEKRALQERRLCKICMNAEISCLLLPCCHFVSCDRCARALEQCPLCRRQILEIKSVFTT